MKKTVKNNTLKKIDSVHNGIDKLFIDKKIDTNVKFDLQQEEIFIKEQSLTKKDLIEDKQEHINTAIETDIKQKDIELVNESNSSDLLKAMEILHSPNNLESNTILNNPQVIAMSVINYLAQAYDINFFKVFIKTFPRYRISGDDGRGRKEMIEIANAIRRDKEEEHQRFMEILGRR